MTLSESCRVIVAILKELATVRRERDLAELRADRAAAAFHAQVGRLREAYVEIQRLRRRSRERIAA